MGFVTGAMSCPEPGTASAYVREGQCYWARLSGGRLDWDRTDTAWAAKSGHGA